jgi:alpha-galactosidase
VNGPNVFGARPGAPVLYAVPVSGQRPIEYSADDLPAGLQIDGKTGQISGKLDQPGEHVVTLRAKNALGAAEKKLRIVIGDEINLTPPLGWSSWNCWGDAVSQEKVLSSARAMVEKGLRDHGWTYINIDDGWQGPRGGPHNAIQPNKKFADMKGLGDELHALGLKFGIYSSPWRGTYAGYVGGSSDNADGAYDWINDGDHDDTYHFGKAKKVGEKDKPSYLHWRFGKTSFAEQDAAQWAEWGVDYLKYDWFPNDPPHVKEMADALRKTGHDISYSLSNTGLFDYAATYAELSQVWRTTGDIVDTWDSMATRGFGQDRWAGFTGPGHWADPDMLVVGKVGWGPNLHDTRLNADEQYTHISLWSLLSAPMLLGCDLAQLDAFTIGLLTNDEVLAINQDSLGKQATQASNDGVRIVYSKTLEDGSIAVGLFNRGDTQTVVRVSWGPWGSMPTKEGGKFSVRDLWRQKDLGTFDGKFESKVNPHGVVLVRLSRQK